ncbi:protein kinase [Planosporangium flavigriseum]|nr:protein kinase [Planosporangium flavigriseum]
MSVVWRAYDEVLGRHVAVKMLSGRYVGDEASRDLIRAEAQSAGRLSHPHVTSVYDYGEVVEQDGSRVPFVVMELVEGSTLDARLAQGPLPWAVSVRVAAEVAAALAAAHARGLVHRDIKPANVMLTPAGVKVVDFGIAAVVGANADSSPTVLGTPAYLAPERLGGSAVTTASDVYALGLLLFRMLTGQLPWQAETVTQMITAHRYTDPGPLPTIAGLPAAVAGVCTRSLAKAPADRPTAEEVASTLAAAAGIRVPLPRDDALTWNVPVSTDGATEPINDRVPASLAAKRDERRRRPRVAAMAAGAAAIVTVTGVATWSTMDGKSTATAAAMSEIPAQQNTTPPATCEVRYQTKKDEGGAFAVDVSVANVGSKPVSDWTLRFDFPADQKVTGGTGAAWTQSGPSVTARGTGTLAPAATATVSLTGGYQGSNPIPTDFTLNDAACRATVTGAVAVPVVLPGTKPADAKAAGTGAGTGSAAKPAAAPTTSVTAKSEVDAAKRRLEEWLKQQRARTGNGNGKGGNGKGDG